MVLGATTFDNHLSTALQSGKTVRFQLSHAPTKIWVASLRGLPRSTFHVSMKTTSLWHFSELAGPIKDLAPSLAVTYHYVPRLMDSPSTITTSITAGASMDFPHDGQNRPPRDYPKIARLFLILSDLFAKDFFFKTIQAAQDVKISCR